ncbi:hypothetical protein TELCIR_21301, partial [Teladorsagia circumcincta]
EQKFKEAAGFYEPIVSKNFVTAEELMRKVEREEDDARELDETRKCFHVCIINLVIGTLYCSKVSEDLEHLLN